MIQDPGNPSTLYATTGEATTVERSSIPVSLGFGIGILVSRDRGMTWSTLHAGAPARSARRIVGVPGQPQVLVTTNDALGIYRSVDGGTTWSQVRAMDSIPASSDFFQPRFYDLKVDPHDATQLIAGDRVGGIVRGTDAGATWSKRIVIAPSPPQQGRVEVAFAASNPGSVYATVSPEGSGTNRTRLNRSTDAGSTWTFVSDVVAADPVYANYQNGNRSYNNALWVDATDANHVIVGDVDGVVVVPLAAGFHGPVKLSGGK